MPPCVGHYVSNHYSKYPCARTYVKEVTGADLVRAVLVVLHALVREVLNLANGQLRKLAFKGGGEALLTPLASCKWTSSPHILRYRDTIAEGMQQRSHLVVEQRVVDLAGL